jgi:hypothetical protein
MSDGKEKSVAARMLESNAELRNISDQSDLFDVLVNGKDGKPGLKTVKIDDENLYIVEGDTLLDIDQLRAYAIQKEAVNRVRKFAALADEAGLGRSVLVDDLEGALVGITQGGRAVRWRPGLVLTYCVLKRTFTTDAANYDLVRENFKKATEAWENTCGIKFEHKAELDDSPTIQPPGVIFAVRELDVGGQFIAAAFFPNDPTNRRRVIIDPSYYSGGSFDKVGVLRHEIGHILGFRHEHIRQEAPVACPDEPLFNTLNLTDFDPVSVMHYLCGGSGTNELKISELDKIGAQKLYGPPLTSVQFVD